MASSPRDYRIAKCTKCGRESLAPENMLLLHCECETGNSGSREITVSITGPTQRLRLIKEVVRLQDLILFCRNPGEPSFHLLHEESRVIEAERT